MNNSIQWQTGIPDVPVGGQRRLWCAYKGVNGKIYHAVLSYYNAFVSPLTDLLDDLVPSDNAVPVGDDGEYAWTGWFQESCDHCDTYWGFDRPVIAWMELPKYTENES